jgi:hypothetical protein
MRISTVDSLINKYETNLFKDSGTNKESILQSIYNYRKVNYVEPAAS